MRRSKPKRNGYSVVESLVVLGLLFVLTVLIASLARYHIGGGAAETKQEMTPKVPDSVSPSPARETEPPSPTIPEKDSAAKESGATDGTP